LFFVRVAALLSLVRFGSLPVGSAVCTLLVLLGVGNLLCASPCESHSCLLGWRAFLAALGARPEGGVKHMWVFSSYGFQPTRLTLPRLIPLGPLTSCVMIRLPLGSIGGAVRFECL